MHRVVLDVNVLVSAFISTSGAPARILDAWFAGVFEVLVSPKLLDELRDVLGRPKIRRYATAEEAALFVAALQAEAIPVVDPRPVAGATRDPGDDYLIALAGAEADALVTCDKEVRNTRKPPVPILTPREMLDRLGL